MPNLLVPFRSLHQRQEGRGNNGKEHEEVVKTQKNVRRIAYHTINEAIKICTHMILNIFLNSVMKSCSCRFIQHRQFISFCINVRQYVHIILDLQMLSCLQGGLEWLFHFWITILRLWIKFCAVCLPYEHHNCNKINTLKLSWVLINIRFNSNFSKGHNSLQWKHWICNRNFK